MSGISDPKLCVMQMDNYVHRAADMIGSIPHQSLYVYKARTRLRRTA